MIALLDYGAGNLRSVEKALRYVGSDVELMQTPDRVKDADAVAVSYTHLTLPTTPYV